jgi:predicted RNase H-like HicB family nuclease
MRYAVCLETESSGASRAHVPDLPGCMAVADAPRAAVEGLFAAVPAYWAWLRAHGVTAPGPDDLGEVTLGVVEIVRDQPPGASALFAYESTGAITPQAVQTCLERLAYSRQDLLAALARLPPEALDDGAPGGVAALLMSLAAAERWYTRLLGPPGRLKAGATALERLAHVRAGLTEAIRGLPVAAYGDVINRGGERWTLRMLLRVMIEQERDTTARIVAAGAPAGGKIVDNLSASVDN